MGKGFNRAAGMAFRCKCVFSKVRSNKRCYSPTRFGLGNVGNMAGIGTGNTALAPGNRACALTDSNRRAMAIRAKGNARAVGIGLHDSRACRFVARGKVCCGGYSTYKRAASPRTVPDVRVATPRHIYTKRSYVMAINALPDNMAVRGNLCRFRFVNTSFRVARGGNI